MKANKLNGALVALVVGSVVGAANAVIDVSAITAAGVDVAAVGAAVFLVYVGIKVFKMVRASL